MRAEVTAAFVAAITARRHSLRIFSCDRGGSPGKFKHLVPRECELVSPTTTPSTSSLRTPANAGTHNHRRMLLSRLEQPPSKNNLILWLWAPAFRRGDGESCAFDFARRANVSHPDGHCLNPQIRTIIHAIPCSQEGRFAIVTNVGRGMRWTRRVSRRMTMSRTAKSYGPGAPTLASSWR